MSVTDATPTTGNSGETRPNFAKLRISHIERTANGYELVWYDKTPDYNLVTQLVLAIRLIPGVLAATRQISGLTVTFTLDHTRLSHEVIDDVNALIQPRFVRDVTMAMLRTTQGQSITVSLHRAYTDEQMASLITQIRGVCSVKSVTRDGHHLVVQLWSHVNSYEAVDIAHDIALTTGLRIIGEVNDITQRLLMHTLVGGIVIAANNMIADYFVNETKKPTKP